MYSILGTSIEKQNNEMKNTEAVWKKVYEEKLFELVSDIDLGSHKRGWDRFDIENVLRKSCRRKQQ